MKFMMIQKHVDGLSLLSKYSIRRLNKMKCWCRNHIKTLDDIKNPSCTAHLAEGRCFECPYKSQEDRLKTEYPCSDFKPIE